MRQLFRFAGVYLAVSTFAGIALLADTWPLYPRSSVEWILLFVIALPVTVLGEWLAEGLTSNPLSAKVERSRRRVGFSWARVGYYLATYVLFGLCAAAIFYWARSS